MIRIAQTLTEADYQQAAAIHHATYRSSRYRPWMAGLLMIIGIYLLASSIQPAFGLFAMAYSVLMMLRKRLWVRRMLKSVTGAKTFGEEIRVTIDEGGVIRSEQGSDRSQLHVQNLVGFVHHPIGILLYPQRNLFYFLKAEGFESHDQIDALLRLLRTHEINEMRV